MRKVKVYFIPYAGGSSLSYWKWQGEFNSNIEPYFIELAGRGSMDDKPFYESVDEAAEHIADTISKTCCDSEYMIYGHSMGALLAFEAYYKLIEKNAKLPKHIFFSGREAPETDFCRDKIYEEDDDVFLKKISIFDGLPVNFPNNDFKEYFTSILKADFKILIKYEYRPKSEKIKCSATILFGESDRNVTLEGAEKWIDHVGGKSEIYKFEGSHFFINEKYKEIVKLIEKQAKSIE